jgi:putative FmdB family regulatory protein
MPLYEYACTKCGRVHEVRHGFNESHQGVCEACGSALRRVFNPAPVLFKGSGFYVTDSRRPAASDAAQKPKDEATPAKSDAPAAKSDAPAAKSDPPAAKEPKGGSGASEPAA